MSRPSPPPPQDSFHKCNSKESKGLHRRRGIKHPSLWGSIKSICRGVLFETYYLSSLFKCASLHFFSMTRSSKDQSASGAANQRLFNILTGREKDFSCSARLVWWGRKRRVVWGGSRGGDVRELKASRAAEDYVFRCTLHVNVEQ